MAGIRSFNVGKAATPGNTFHRHFQYGEGTDSKIYGYYIVTRGKCD